MIITEDQLPADNGQTNEESSPPEEQQGPQATTDEYGLSTKLDRPNVHTAVLATYSIYSQF